jgi:chlorobactene glucosyltransferase
MDAGLPSVSVIVPARNEEHTLPRLLGSLRSLDYPLYEVIVVDDDSTDATARVAAAHGARVVAAGPLPDGWVGKPHACQAGAGAARNGWLLFTDADTCHDRASLSASMALVMAHDLDALSVFCGQRCEGYWERLLLPFAYRHFFAGVSSRAANDPARREALANGQYLLISREAYERIGGHAAVRASIVEDVAIARVIKRAGLRFRILRAERLVEVRMYRGLAEIRGGFAKNSVRFLADDPGRGARVLASTLLDGAVLPLVMTGVLRRDRLLIASGLGSWAIAASGMRPWLRVFGVPSRYALLQPLASVVFQTITLAGITAMRRGGTQWKGRRY